MTRRALLWAVAALLGLAVTAAMTWSVSRLTREHIGLSAEPRTMLNGLAPPRALPPGRDTGAGAGRTTATSRPARRPSAGAGSAPVSPVAPSVATPIPAPTNLAPVRPHPSRGDNRDDSGGGSRAGSGGPDD